MISLSNRDVETLRQLAAFGELLRSPDRFRDLVASAESAAKAYEDAVAAYTTVSQANRYLEDSRLKVNEGQKKVSDANVEAAAVREKLAKEKSEHAVKLAEQDAVRVASERTLAAKQVLVEKMQTDVEARLRALVTKEEDYQRREQQLAAAEKSQRERAAQIVRLAKEAA